MCRDRTPTFFCVCIRVCVSLCEFVVFYITIINNRLKALLCITLVQRLDVESSAVTMCTTVQQTESRRSSSDQPLPCLRVVWRGSDAGSPARTGSVPKNMKRVKEPAYMTNRGAEGRRHVMHKNTCTYISSITNLHFHTV